MKDETKEILKNIWYRLDCDTLISKRYGIELDKNECKILKNYITNLQESEAYYYGQYKDYKSRNEKALDKLYCYGEVFDSKILQEFQKEMENILNGGD